MKDDEVEMIHCLALKRKSDGIEVYSAPCDDDSMKCIDFYFKRVNSGIEAVLSSDKTPAEKKAGLKLLKKEDFYLEEEAVWNYGGWHKHSSGIKSEIA